MPGIPVQNSTTERLLNSRRTNCNLISNYKPTCLVLAKLGECIVATIGLATLLIIICLLRQVYNRKMLQWYLAYGGWSLSSKKVFVLFLYRSRIPYVYSVERLGTECLASFGKWVLLAVAV
ncbi:hypothetical protein M0802_013999 [Mischocyttarus mexicanus]|nr:hypothetical protein M0802_013999 [Mischocyttarus mexicanus]